MLELPCATDGPQGCKPQPPKPDDSSIIDLFKITCACGYGYYKPDRTWIPGSEVRAGRASPKENVDVSNLA
jgi:hypothetical protein